MENTNYFPYYDNAGKIKTINLFGKELAVKNYICSEDGIYYRRKPKETVLQLSVCLTSRCMASCPFCSAGNTNEEKKIDLKKLERVLTEIKKEVRILCVSFTGGEPFDDIKLLDEAVSVVFGVFGFDMQVSVKTNGIRLMDMHKIKYLPQIDTIHISRHHYDDAVNDRLFGIHMPGTEELREIIHSVEYRDIFVINCLLLKNAVSTPAEAHKMLDYAIYLGVPKISFITCMPVNKFAAEQRIRFDDVIREDDSSLLFTRGYHDFDVCRCKDGIYVSDKGDIVEFYGRTTEPQACSYCRGLVYGADNRLRNGFQGQVIYE